MAAVLSSEVALTTEPQSVTAENVARSPFDILAAYKGYLQNGDLPMPIAAVLALTDLIANSDAGTMYELVEALKDGAATLKKRTPNPISLTAGCDIFIQYVTTTTQEFDNFEDQKADLVRQGKEYATNNSHNCREKIADLAFGFIKDEAVILTHSYSRVVMQALLHAHKRKRISVYVTEARPRGLGNKTYEALTSVGIPCTVVLDSAVAYIMDKVDIVLMGSEAVVESGGLINSVGSYQTAIIAKAANKPVYALAESYKFLRYFPLSQYDLPTHNQNILALPAHRSATANTQTRRPSLLSSSNFLNSSDQLVMSEEQLRNNPEVDYTRPELITLVLSDAGILTPEGVSQYLVGIYAE
jgi:translation initiation factor eIF-2B subunit alpha